MADKVLIVGGGTFGLSSALELQRRGHQVALLDPGPLPHPDASSTDISKVIRMDYGADEAYMQMMEETLDLWRAWNREFGEQVFYETGVLYITPANMQPGDFEYESLRLLEKRGHPIERLTSDDIRKRFPAWKAERYPDGYYNPQGGWSPSGRVTELLATAARKSGAEIHPGVVFASLLEDNERVVGILDEAGKEWLADWVVVAAGSWTPMLLTRLEDVMWPTAQPVMHFKVEELKLFQPPEFPVWTADVGKTGWYGFPAKDDGTLKLANHGPGWRMDPSGTRHVPEGNEQRFREFFVESLPGLANTEKLYERLCFYCDTFDGDFWIDHDPDRPGLIVSTGGSGHAFKFTPLLGRLTADVLEARENPYLEKFAWRQPGDIGYEEARYGESQPGK